VCADGSLPSAHTPIDFAYTNNLFYIISYLYSFSDKNCIQQQQWLKHVVDVDKLYTPDNMVVLRLLYPYGIITSGKVSPSAASDCRGGMLLRLQSCPVPFCTDGFRGSLFGNFHVA